MLVGNGTQQIFFELLGGALPLVGHFAVNAHRTAARGLAQQHHLFRVFQQQFGRHRIAWVASDAYGCRQLQLLIMDLEGSMRGPDQLFRDTAGFAVVSTAQHGAELVSADT